MPNSFLDASQTRPQPVELAEEIEQLWNGRKSHTAFREDASRRQIRLPNMRNGKNIKKMMPQAISPTTIEKPEEHTTQLHSTPVPTASERSGAPLSVLPFVFLMVVCK